MNQQKFFNPQNKTLSVSQVGHTPNAFTPNMKQNTIFHQQSRNQLNSLYASQMGMRATSPRQYPIGFKSLRSQIPSVKITYTNQPIENKSNSIDKLGSGQVFHSGFYGKIESAKSDVGQGSKRIDQLRLSGSKFREPISQENETSPVNPLKIAVSPIYVKNLTQSLKPENLTSSQQNLHNIKTQMSEEESKQLLRNSNKIPPIENLNKSLSQNKEEHQGMSTKYEIKNLQPNEVYQSMFGPPHKKFSGVESDSKFSYEQKDASDLRKQLENERRKFNLERSEMCIKEIENESIRRQVQRLRKKRVELQTQLEEKQKEVIKLEKKILTKEFERKNSYEEQIGLKEELSFKEESLKSQEMKLRLRERNLAEEREKLYQETQNVEKKKKELGEIQMKRIELDSQQKYLHELRVKNISEEKKIESKAQQIQEKQIELEQKMKYMQKEMSRLQQLQRKVEEKSKFVDEQGLMSKNRLQDEIIDLTSKKELMQSHLLSEQSKLNQMKNIYSDLQSAINNLTSQQTRLQELVKGQNQLFQQISDQNKNRNIELQRQNTEFVTNLTSQKQRLLEEIKSLEETMQKFSQENHKISIELENKSMNAQILEENIKRFHQEQEKLAKLISTQQSQLKELGLEVKQCETRKMLISHEIVQIEEKKHQLINGLESQKQKQENTFQQNFQKYSQDQSAAVLALAALKKQIDQLEVQKVSLAKEFEEEKIRLTNHYRLPDLQEERNSVINQINQAKQQLIQLEEQRQSLSSQQLKTTVITHTEINQNNDEELNKLKGELQKMASENNRLVEQLFKVANECEFLKGQINQLKNLIPENQMLFEQKQRLIMDLNALGGQFDNLKRAYEETLEMRGKFEIMERNLAEKGNIVSVLRVEVQRKNAELNKFKMSANKNEQLVNKNVKNAERIMGEYKKLEAKYEELLKKTKNQAQWKGQIIKSMEESFAGFTIFLAKIHDTNNQDYQKMAIYRETLRKANIKVSENEGISQNAKWASIFTNLISSHILNTRDLYNLGFEENHISKIQPILSKLNECLAELEGFTK